MDEEVVPVLRVEDAARAVACLPALIGAWRHRAGGLLLSSSGQFPIDKAALQRPDLLAGRTPEDVQSLYERRRSRYEQALHRVNGDRPPGEVADDVLKLWSA